MQYFNWIKKSYPSYFIFVACVSQPRPFCNVKQVFSGTIFLCNFLAFDNSITVFLLSFIIQWCNLYDFEPLCCLVAQFMKLLL